MKINEDFIYILRYWHQSFMLSTVRQDNGLPDRTNFYRPKFWFVLSGASSSDSASLTSCQFQLLSKKDL